MSQSPDFVLGDDFARVLTETTMSLVCVLGEDGRILFFNEACERLTGFTRAEAGLRCDLAAALHVRGEHDEARRHLKKARELAQLTGSARQRRRIRDLSKRIGEAA